MQEKIILGIDPGYDRCGVAVISSVDNKNTLLFSDCLLTNKKESVEKRIYFIFENLEEIIKKYRPQILGIEKLFFTNNQKTAMDVSKSIGTVYILSEKYKLNLLEITPMQVKVGITGNGRASKSDIEFMTRKLIKIESEKNFIDDEFDAIAIAIVAAAFRVQK